MDTVVAKVVEEVTTYEGVKEVTINVEGSKVKVVEVPKKERADDHQ